MMVLAIWYCYDVVCNFQQQEGYIPPCLIVSLQCSKELVMSSSVRGEIHPPYHAVFVFNTVRGYLPSSLCSLFLFHTVRNMPSLQY